jgi:hypothetical protein
MMSLLFASLWGLLVLVSFAALGRIISRLVRPDGECRFFLAASWGMAGMTVLGGILNLIGVATSDVLVALVLAMIVAGIVFQKRGLLGIRDLFAAPDPVPGQHQTGRGAWVWVGLLVLLVAFKYVSSAGHVVRPFDDRAGYLIQLARLLQTGSVGLDPFSEHQLNSLNGQTFLVALVVSASSFEYAYLLDPGICWIMIAGLTWSMIHGDFRGSIRESCLLTAFVLLVATPYHQNLGGHLTGAVLYLVMVQTAYSGTKTEDHLDRGSILLLGLALAGLCALKSTFLIFGALFLLSWYALRLGRQPRSALARELSLVGIAAIVLLLPWMWQQYRSGGTFLYPFLGRGYFAPGRDISNLQNLITVIGKSSKAVAHLLLSGQLVPVTVALALCAGKPAGADPARWRVDTASLAAVLGGALALTFILSTDDQATRYSAPFLYAALIPVGLAGFSSARTSWNGLGLALCLVMYVGNQWDDLYDDLSSLRKSLDGRTAPLLQGKERIRNAQASIPAGARILVSLKDAFLADFSRNPIWHFNHPGMVSPPPGLPLPADRFALEELIMGRTSALPPPAPSAPLLSYLRLAGVDFVLFQRGVPGDFWWEDAESFSQIDSPWVRRTRALGELIYKQLEQLKDQCPVVLDDGDIVALDLRAPHVAATRSKRRYSAGPSNSRTASRSDTSSAAEASRRWRASSSIGTPGTIDQSAFRFQTRGKLYMSPEGMP